MSPDGLSNRMVHCGDVASIKPHHITANLAHGPALNM